MQSKLRKMAAHLRELAKKREETKLVKCAQAAQALIGLATLRRKIG
jgi:hypothetical protein